MAKSVAKKSAKSTKTVAKVAKKSTKTVATKEAKKPNELHDALVKLMLRPSGATIADFQTVDGFNIPSMAVFGSPNATALRRLLQRSRASGRSIRQ